MADIDTEFADGPHSKENQLAPPKLTRNELEERLRVEFPEMFHASSDFVIDELWLGGCRLRQRYDVKLLRPGDTIGGPTMMALGRLCHVFRGSERHWLGAACRHHQSDHQLPQQAQIPRPSRRGTALETRKAARCGRNQHSLGRRGRPRRARDLDIFDTTFNTTQRVY